MSKNKVGPPKSQAGFSSNWKKLQVSLKAETKKRRVTAPENEQKRRKVGSKADFRKEKTRPANGLHRGKKPDSAEEGARGKKPDSAEEGARGKQTNPAPEKNEIWFDDVDEMLLERPVRSHPDQDPLVFQNAVTHPTKALAMDCEMVGVGTDGVESVLARVSIVNQHGHCLYDKFVKAREKVTDYRTHVSGVRPRNLRTAEAFLVVQKEVSDLLKGKLLVGHAIHNDLKVLFLDHPRRQIRDTSTYKPFKQLFGGRKPGLKKLSAKVLGVSVQEGEHSSVQDAQATMRLYMTYRKRWESELSPRHKGKKASVPAKK